MTIARMSVSIGLWVCVSLWGPSAYAEAQRASTVEDAVTLRSFESDWRSLTTLAISPNSRQVAYVLREPNLALNVNETLLYVRDLPTFPDPAETPRSQVVAGETLRHNGKVVLRTQGLAHIQWLSDGRSMLVLHKPQGGQPAVERVDAITGHRSTVYAGPIETEAFVASASGDRLVISGRLPLEKRTDRLATRSGLVVTDQDSAWSLESTPRNDAWRRPAVVKVVDSGGASATIYRTSSDSANWPILPLSLSPDGRYLTFVTRAKDVAYPERWKDDPWYKRLVAAGHEFPPKVLLFELPESLSVRGDSAEPQAHWPARLAFDSSTSKNAYWSDDSSTYLIRAPAPVGDGEKVAKENRRGQNAKQGLYAVVAATGETTEVMEDAPESIVAFDERGTRIIVKLASGEIVTLHRESTANGSNTVNVANNWVVRTRKATNVAGYKRRTHTTGNGRLVVGVAESTMVPPDLYLLDLEQGKQILITEINPELRQLVLGRVERIEWSGSHGLRYWGQLIYPIGYVPGTRYPCVIMAKGWDDSFILGGQAYYGNNFPAQPLAGAGFVVLLLDDHVRYYEATGLQEAPGRTAEAVIAVDQFETARQMLDKLDLIDTQRVGVLGFSRSSWKVDFLLTRESSKEPWAAAVSVDSGIYNYGVYFYARSRASRAAYHLQYGGPPYGSTFKTWQQYAPAFGAARARTPLLMQYHGSLAGAAEFYVALREQGKPVELIYFPEGKHILELPSERRASMWQVVDWFRFWLQGFERQNLEQDPERYQRWLELRKQHDLNEKVRADGKDPAQEFIRSSQRAAQSRAAPHNAED